MAGVSLDRVRDRARSTFWLVPAVCGTWLDVVRKGTEPVPGRSA